MPFFSIALYINSNGEMEEVASKIKDILVEKMGIAETEVTPDANLIKDLGIDSLDYAELVMEFEHTFSVRIPDEDAEHLTTVQSAVDYIVDKLGKA